MPAFPVRVREASQEEGGEDGDRSRELQKTFNEIQFDSNAISNVQIGLGRPITPAMLLVIPHFLHTYGFASQEVVWFRPASAVPLERAILAPAVHLGLGLNEEGTQAVAKQLFGLSEREPVMLQQGFDFVTRLELEAKVKEEEEESESESESESEEEEEKEEKWRDYVVASIPAHLLGQLLTFTVLETFPVMQGRITRDTTLVLLPSDSSPFPSPSRPARRQLLSGTGSLERSETPNSEGSLSDLELYGDRPRWVWHVGMARNTTLYK